jgi:hypothetical protein
MVDAPKVVSLRTGAEILQPGEPHPAVVDILEDLLERARSGEIVAISAAVMNADKSAGRYHAGQISYTLLGALETLKVKIASDL